MDSAAPSSPAAGFSELFSDPNAAFIKAGYLQKFAYWTQKWEKRYFVLTKNALYYFRRPEDSELLGELRFHLPLEGCSVTLGTKDLTFRVKQETASFDPTLDTSAAASSPSSTSASTSNRTAEHPPPLSPPLPPPADETSKERKDREKREKKEREKKEKERKEQEKRERKLMKKQQKQKKGIRMGVSMMMLGRHRSVLCRAESAESFQSWLRALREVQSRLEVHRSEAERQRLLELNARQVQSVFMSDDSDDPDSEHDRGEAEEESLGSTVPSSSSSSSSSTSRSYSGHDSQLTADSPEAAESTAISADCTNDRDQQPGIPLSPKQNPPTSPRSARTTSAEQPQLCMLTIGSHLDGARQGKGMAERIAVRGCSWRTWMPIMVHPGDVQLVAVLGDGTEVRISLPRITCGSSSRTAGGHRGFGKQTGEDDDFFPVLVTSPPPPLPLNSSSPSSETESSDPARAQDLLFYSLPTRPLSRANKPTASSQDAPAEAAETKEPQQSTPTLPQTTSRTSTLPADQGRLAEPREEGFQMNVYANPIAIWLDQREQEAFQKAASPQSGANSPPPSSSFSPNMSPTSTSRYSRVCRVSWKPFPGPLGQQAKSSRPSSEGSSSLEEKPTERPSPEDRLARLHGRLALFLLLLSLFVSLFGFLGHVSPLLERILHISTAAVLGGAVLRPGGLEFRSSPRVPDRPDSSSDDPLLRSSQVIPSTQEEGTPTLWLVKFHYVCFRFEMDEYLDLRQKRERELYLQELEAEKEALRAKAAQGHPTGGPGQLSEEDIERIRQNLISVGTTRERWGRWGPADHSPLKLRGSNYLKDKIKIPAYGFSFDLAHTEIVPRGEKLHHVAANPKGFPALYRSLFPPGRAPLLLVINFQVNLSFPQFSLQLFYSKIPVSRQLEDHPDDRDAIEAGERLLQRFLDSFGPDETGELAHEPDRGGPENIAFRRNTLKFIPRVVNGGFVVRKVVGGKPAIIGNKLTMVSYYNERDGYLEVDIDVSSSVVARKIWGAVKNYAGKLSMDICWTLEGQEPQHLPERLLGGVRIEDVDIPWMEEEQVRNDTQKEKRGDD